jgi:hypothetical protein
MNFLQESIIDNNEKILERLNEEKQRLLEILREEKLKFQRRERINHNRQFAIEKRERIARFRQTVPDEDKQLTQLFNWRQFREEQPLEPKDVVFGEKYMYLPGGTTGIVRAYPLDDESAINVEFIETGEQDILFPQETQKKLYKLPILPQNLSDSIKQLLN